MTDKKVLYATGAVLIQLRQDAGLNQQAVATGCKFNYASYNRMENGKQKVCLIDLFALAAFYQVSAADIVERIAKQIK